MKKLKRFIKHGERQGANPPDIPSKDDSVAVLVTSSKSTLIYERLPPCAKTAYSKRRPPI